MKIKELLGVVAVLGGLFFGSCQKTDKPVVLPAKGDAEFGLVEMGEDYTYQLFFDFETASIVKVSEINSWDLAFDASTKGFNVFMNGGADVNIYNTHETEFKNVNSEDLPEPFSKEWAFDAPSLVNDSTAIGDWRDGNASKGEIFVVRQNATHNTNNLKKVKLISVNGIEYVMEYADIDDNQTKVIRIPKNEKFNYAYFSFDDGGKIVEPDPPKAEWDIVFTRYRHIYRHLEDFPYIVSGPLLNPNNTMAAEDSTQKYEEIVGDMIFDMDFSNSRDVVGFDWKEYSTEKERYTVKRDKVFVIKNRNDQYWKMHFLDFYNQQGIKGSPSFEFERMY